MWIVAVESGPSFAYAQGVPVPQWELDRTDAEDAADQALMEHLKPGVHIERPERLVRVVGPVRLRSDEFGTLYVESDSGPDEVIAAMCVPFIRFLAEGIEASGLTAFPGADGLTSAHWKIAPSPGS